MFGKRKAVELTWLQFQGRHAEDVTREAFRAILKRDPDPAALKHWSTLIRDGMTLETVVGLMLGSPEYLARIYPPNWRDQESHLELPLMSRRIALIANCHGGMYAHAMQVLTGCRAPTWHPITSADAADADALARAMRELADTHDVILVQAGDFADKIRSRAPALDARISFLPSINFSGYHPDICCLNDRKTGKPISGILNGYHSSIVYYAWRAGMSQRETLEHFRPEVYSALHFDRYWDASVFTLREQGRQLGRPLERLIDSWRRGGCFMHAHNHPKARVFASVAREVLELHGIPTLPIEAADFMRDAMSEAHSFPVYPEIAERLGCPGSYQFELISRIGSDRNPVVRFISLEEFIGYEFRTFAEADRDAIVCDRVESQRYREVFGGAWKADAAGNAVRKASIAASADASATAIRHPYQGLPAVRFWRAAVGQVPTADVDPVSPPRFQIKASTRIVTAGSCFAQHIARALVGRGCAYLVSEPAPAGTTPAEAEARQFGVYSARYGNIYTPRQLLQLVARANGDFAPGEAAWLRPDGRWADPFRPEIEPDGFASIADLEADRAGHLGAVRQLLESMEVFVFTLGLTEAWASREDGAVFPLAPGVTAGSFDPQRHVFLNFGVDDVVADLESFLQRLATINPGASVLFTVSPVPLAATYTNQHVLAATVHSKAVLRAAVQIVCDRHLHCDYFPSFEIVSGHYNRGAYYESDLRSVTASGVDHVMRQFFKHYLPDNNTAPAIDPSILAELRAVQKVICEEALLDPEAVRAREPTDDIESESRIANIGSTEIPFTATSGDLPVTKKKMEEILWFHQVPLPDGRITPGVAAHYLLESNYLFDRLDFKGKSVLDIGCWDGYFSFMAEKRGAARVVGLDNPDFRVGGEDGFQFLHEIFNSSVEWRRGSVFDLPISERFDIVLCYGVIYHINDPLTAITNCFQVANERVVFEGLIFESNLPALVLLAPGEIGGDVSNIHTASTEYIKNVAELNGFRLIEQRLFPMSPSNPKLDRGTMMFERYAEKRPAYLPTCFSLAPSCYC